jgi:hypothetical protein
MNAELLMLLSGTGVFLLTVLWVRQRGLDERHALGWLLLAGCILLCGLFPQIIERAADSAHLSYPAAVLFIALGIVYVFAFSVSVALTRLNRRSTRLLQQIALLECRIRELEAGRTSFGETRVAPPGWTSEPGAKAVPQACPEAAGSA